MNNDANSIELTEEEVIVSQRDIIIGKDKQIAELATKLELALGALNEIATTDSYCQECAAYRKAEKALDQLAAPDTDHCPSCGEYLHDEMGHMCPPHNAALKERDRAVADVLRERSFQDKQWGGLEHDDTHSWHDWIRYIQYQVSKGCIPTRRREGLVKIAALAIAGIESHDRKFRIEFGLNGK